MTNEKWFDSLTTREKAEWIAGECHSAASEYYHENQKGSWDADYWEEWLKEEHSKKIGVAESE